jgi:type IV pilus assembly protein PilM
MVTRGKRIARLAEMPMESDLTAVDSKEKEAELSKKIQHLLKFNKIGKRKVILGVSGLHCLTRPIVLPELPRAMLGEAVIREAKRILPMPLEQLYLSWQVISVTGGKTNIYLVALPRQIADMVIRVINHAGCKPYLMDIKPLALARLSTEATAVILDVQPKEFDIVMMVNGIPQPVRTIAFPQEALPLQEKFNIVKEDLKRTLEFIKAKTEEKQITPDTTLFVSGELTEHPELYQPAAAELGLKVAKLASPLKYLKYLEPAPYMVNAGLALKEMPKISRPLLPDFNTLPIPYLPKHISVNKLMAIPAAACAAGVLILLAISVQGAAANISNLQNQLDTAKFLIAKGQAQKLAITEKISALEQNKAGAESEYDTYSAALRKLTTTGNIMNTDLNAAVDNIQTGLRVTSLSLNDSQIAISGSADNEEEIFRFVRDLTSTGRFEEITIGSIETTIEEAENDEELATISCDYSLSCRLKAGRE